jgi:hypothetical protein
LQERISARAERAIEFMGEIVSSTGHLLQILIEMSVAAKIGAILAGRKGPVERLRYGRGQALRSMNAGV